MIRRNPAPVSTTRTSFDATRRNLSRRTLLRGAGSVAIALPFFRELVPCGASAAEMDPPVRVVTAFFGLGIDPAWQAERFEGPLAPYEPIAGKMAFFTNVNMNQGSGGAHCENSPVIFVGEKNPSENRAGGASIDQRIRQALDPTASTLSSGLWWRRGACDAQALRVWNPDGTARPPIKRPSEVFQQLFGSLVSAPPPGTPPDPELLRELHVKRSILDTVMAQYEHYASAASPLGTTSKQKLELHLQSIREIELALAPSEDILTGGGGNPACVVPNSPNDPDIGADYDKFTYGTGSGAPGITWQDFQAVYHLHADLWVAALRCDLVRYGNIAFESAGGHTNFSGTYSAIGLSTDWPDDSQHDSYFHTDKPTHARLYQHLASANIAYFLEQLDGFTEENGKSLLDNTTIIIGTEYGKNHSSNGVMHAIAGGTARFRPGFYEQDLNAIDVYNAVLAGHGLPQDVGVKTDVASEGSADDVLV